MSGTKIAVPIIQFQFVLARHVLDSDYYLFVIIVFSINIQFVSKNCAVRYARVLHWFSSQSISTLAGQVASQIAHPVAAPWPGKSQYTDPPSADHVASQLDSHVGSSMASCAKELQQWASMCVRNCKHHKV